jgi:hypothetical protein
VAFSKRQIPNRIGSNIGQGLENLTNLRKQESVEMMLPDVDFKMWQPGSGQSDLI